MQTQITARHFTATDALRSHIADALGKLERLYDGIVDARVVLDERNGGGAGCSAEVSVNVYRRTLTAKAEAKSHEEAVDDCIRQLRRQMLRYKSKLRGSHA